MENSLNSYAKNGISFTQDTEGRNGLPRWRKYDKMEEKQV